MGIIELIRRNDSRVPFAVRRCRNESKLLKLTARRKAPRINEKKGRHPQRGTATRYFNPPDLALKLGKNSVNLKIGHLPEFLSIQVFPFLELGKNPVLVRRVNVTIRKNSVKTR